VTSSHSSTSAVYDPSIELVFTSPTNAREPNLYLVTLALKIPAELALVAIGTKNLMFCEGTEPHLG